MRPRSKNDGIILHPVAQAERDAPYGATKCLSERLAPYGYSADIPAAILRSSLARRATVGQFGVCSESNSVIHSDATTAAV